MWNNEQKCNTHKQFILGIHADSPGLTERSIGAARTAEGLSSYQDFCDFAEPRPGQVVIDLACGNGALSEIIAERVAKNGRLVGVDLSAAELKLAKERLRSFENTAWLQESAERLSLPNASADLILCHMAFMLFAPLEPAVDEIARILKPGGAFAAVIPTLRKPTELFRECAGILKSLLKDENHDLAAMSGNARPMESMDDLRSIFAGTGWESETIQTHDINVFIAATPEALVKAIIPAFYNYRLLSAASQLRLEEKWRDLFHVHRNSLGLTHFHFPLSAFMIRKRCKSI